MKTLAARLLYDLLRRLEALSRAVVFLGLALAAACPRPLLAAYLAGYVTGPDNVPVIRASVIVQGEGDERRVELTDAFGAFRVSPLEAGLYSLSVEADGFLPYTRFDVDVVEPKTLVTIRLEPETGGVGQVEALASFPAASGAAVESLPLEMALLLFDEDRGWLRWAAGYHAEGVEPTFKSPSFKGAGFFGAGPAESRTRLDGLDITDPLSGLPLLDFPEGILESVSVNAAGAGTAAGGATSGWIEEQSGHGGNRFRGEFRLLMTPYSEAEPERLEPQQEEAYAVRRQDRLLFAGQTLIALEGYLAKDRLWFFVGAAPELSLGATTRTLGSDSTDYDRFQLRVPCVAKLTYNLSPDHSIQASGYYQSVDLFGVIREPTDSTTGLNGEPSTFLGHTFRTLYGGALHDGVRLREYRTRADFLFGGFITEDTTEPDLLDRDQDGNPDGYAVSTWHEAPYLLPDLECGGGPCMPSSYLTGGYGAYQKISTLRLEGRMQATHQIRDLAGVHDFSWGMGYVLDQVSHSTRLTGRARVADPSSEGQTLLLTQQLEPLSENTFRSLRYGLSLEDRWTLFPFLELEYGARVDWQRIVSGQELFMKLLPTVAPRARLSVPYAQNGESRVVIGYGRQSIELPLWLADAALMTPEVSYSVTGDGVTDDGTTDDGAGSAEELAESSPAFALTPTSSSAYLTAAGVSPILQDEVFLVVRHVFTPGVILRGTWVARNLASTLEPLSYGSSGLVIGNPGTEVAINSGASELDTCFRDQGEVTGEPLMRCYQTPERRYRGLDLRLELRPSRTAWRLLLEYTWSTLRGDYAGPIPQRLGMEPLALTGVYYAPNLETAQGESLRDGDLPADQRHRGQILAVMPVLRRLELGVGAQVSTGTPLMVVAPASESGEGYILLEKPGAAGRGSLLLEQQVGFSYTLLKQRSRRLEVGGTVFNPLGLDSPTRLDFRQVLVPAVVQTGETSGATDLSSLTCYSATGETACEPNPGYQNALELQKQRTVRVFVRYRF